MTQDELVAKYGYDLTKIPQYEAKVNYDWETLITMFKAIIKHGKKNKDVKNAKRTVINYIMKLEGNVEEILAKLNISQAEYIELGFSDFE